jgi:hypothetical protein
MKKATAGVAWFRRPLENAKLCWKFHFAEI